jgi:hypothetical protein
MTGATDPLSNLDRLAEQLAIDDVDDFEGVPAAASRHEHGSGR